MAQAVPVEVRVRRRLAAAGPAAVRFLVQALHNEELPYKDRIDIAKDLLNRGFGKSPVNDAEPASIRLVLSDEASRYAD